MKLSFSTRGWQNFSWQENIETAEIMKFAGIELYNIQKETLYLQKLNLNHLKIFQRHLL